MMIKFKELPGEEKVKVADYIAEIKEKAKRTKISPQEFENVLEMMVKRGILKTCTKEDLEKVKERARKKNYSLYLFKSKTVPERIYYALVGQLGTFSVRGDILHELTEIKNLVEKSEEIKKSKKQEEIAERIWRKEIMKYYDFLLEKMAKGRMHRKTYRNALERAVEWGIIKKSNREEEDLKKEHVPYLKFIDYRQDPESGERKRIEEIYIYSGSKISDLEWKFFKSLRGEFLTAKIKHQKKVREEQRKKREEEIKKIRQRFGISVESKSQKKEKTLKEQLKEIKKELFRDEEFEKTRKEQKSEDKIKRQRKRRERKKLRKKLRAEGKTEEEIDRILKEKGLL
ncbi:hypothetical protein J7K86_02360 [bacterium]|nr:hypothetical protein [bacterium]